MSKPTGKLAFAYATIARLEARIAELEADKGHGEPVARVRHSPIRKRLSVELLRSHMKDGDLLYAEQPAPVAVVMPERRDFSPQSDSEWGWNACLDEVARLNPIKQ